MIRQMKAGSTSETLPVFLQDSSSSTGAGLAGLAHNTGGLTCYYKRSNGTASESVSLANITTLGTYASGGFKAVDGTNQPGLYEFHPPDAALASGAKWVVFYFQGAADLAPTPVLVELTATDNQDATRGGMSAMPNANAGANGGLPTGNASGHVTLADGSLTTAKLGAFVLAKTTNITGFNDITAAAVEAAILNEGDATALLAAISAKVEEFLINDGDATATLAAIATAVRTELATELGRIDVATSTRLASGSYTAPPSAATVASAVRTELATELGRLDAAVSTRQATFTAATSISFPTNFGSLSITVGGVVRADVRAINGVTLTGDGDGTPWGPA